MRKIDYKTTFMAFLLVSAYNSSCIFAATKESQDTVQAGMIFTVAQSKRLIAKAVVQMPIVKNALESGTVIVTKGTTNTRIAEELLGKSIETGSYVFGKILPENSKDPFTGVDPLAEVIFIDGKYMPEMTLEEALEQLQPGDVVIKGGNALDYKNKTAGVMIGTPNSGTSGKIMPYVVGRKAHLVIPIGLEKQISADVVQTQLKMREPVASLNFIPSMFLLTGEIVTELEAMKILADVDIFQAAGGGVAGAEGGVWLIARGSRPAVEKALKIADEIHKEAKKMQEKSE